MSWGQSLVYEAIKVFIHPDTRVKLTITKEMSPEELIDLYHPSQLEKRFGGSAETPKNFWPPHIGSEIQPNNEDLSHLEFI